MWVKQKVKKKVRKKFGFEKILSLKKRIKVPKKLSPKMLDMNKNCVNFGSKKLLGLKQFWAQKIWVQKNVK